MSIIPQLESILFVASAPVSMKKISDVLKVDFFEIEKAVEELIAKNNHELSGIRLIKNTGMIQMVSNPDYAEVVEQFVKNEVYGELTKAQLETLTVVAYRGPITRPELEQIRGVNCAIILRNLLLRGLVVEEDDKEKLLPIYNLSFDALRNLGISNVSELKDYDELHAHQNIERVLSETEEQL